MPTPRLRYYLGLERAQLCEYEAIVIGVSAVSLNELVFVFWFAAAFSGGKPTRGRQSRLGEDPLLV